MKIQDFVSAILLVAIATLLIVTTIYLVVDNKIYNNEYPRLQCVNDDVIIQRVDVGRMGWNCTVTEFYEEDQDVLPDAGTL